MGHLGETLLPDADILIDYLAAERDLIKTFSAELGPLKILGPILNETDGLTATDCRALHIEIVECTTEQLIEAGSDRGPLSFSDRLNYVTCRDAGWTCVTNDGSLRTTCLSNDVTVRRGLSLMVELVRIDSLTPAHARRIAERIAKSNPRYIHRGGIEAFELELQRLAESAKVKRRRG